MMVQLLDGVAKARLGELANQLWFEVLLGDFGMDACGTDEGEIRLLFMCGWQ